MDGGGRVKQDARNEEPGATKAHPVIEHASKFLDRLHDIPDDLNTTLTV